MISRSWINCHAINMSLTYICKKITKIARDLESLSVKYGVPSSIMISKNLITRLVIMNNKELKSLLIMFSGMMSQSNLGMSNLRI